MTSSSLFERFHTAILKNSAKLAECDIKPSGHLSVYLEGYRIRLVQAIRTDYPALLTRLGEKEFKRLALAYIETNPSPSFNLDHYPLGFSQFLSGKLDNGFSLEVAMLENAIAEVFIDEESTPLGPEIMAKLTPESLAALFLKFRTASRLIKFNYPVNDWLTAERAGSNPPVPALKTSYLYVYRHNNNVQRIELQEPEYLLLEQLSLGTSLESTLAHIVAAHPHYGAEILKNLQPWFTGWLEKGFFSA